MEGRAEWNISTECHACDVLITLCVLCVEVLNLVLLWSFPISCPSGCFIRSLIPPLVECIQQINWVNSSEHFTELNQWE